MKREDIQQYIKSTGKGARVEVHVRVYPQGFGQVILRRSEGPIRPLEYMCNNVDEAAACLREIWSCLAQAPGTNDEAATVGSQNK